MRLIILGAGGYGRTVADVAQQLGCYEEILFLDDASTAAVGACEDYRNFADEKTDFYPAFGNNALRVQWLRKLMSFGCSVATVIHPSAYVSPRATVCAGSVIMPKAVVNTNTRVAFGGIVNCGAIVDHDCVLEEGVHICLGAIVKAENRIPAYEKIEAGQVVPNRAYPL